MMPMKQQAATFGCTALQGTNKSGNLKPDADGYYEVVLGALNFYNSAGAFYTYEGSAREIFKASSSFMRRVANGNLRGEYGHPRRQPGMSVNDYVMRLLDIEEAKISHHIKEVRVDSTSVKDKNGNPCIAIIGKVKPCGPMGPALEKQLQNKSENVCFSIRALTTDEFISGRLNKEIRQIVTWDYVNEPGISVANKYASPALEALGEQRVTPNLLHEVRKYQMLQQTVALENKAKGEILNETIEVMGWNEKKLPASARW